MLVSEAYVTIVILKCQLSIKFIVLSYLIILKQQKMNSTLIHLAVSKAFYRTWQKKSGSLCNPLRLRPGFRGRKITPIGEHEYFISTKFHINPFNIS